MMSQRWCQAIRRLVAVWGWRQTQTRTRTHTRTQAIPATTWLWRNMEVLKIDTNHHDFTSCVTLKCVLCVRECVCVPPHVMAGGSLLPALVGVGCENGRLPFFSAVIVEDPPGGCRRKKGQNIKQQSATEQPLSALSALTRDQHRGHTLRCLQEVHVPSLEGLAVVGLQMAAAKRRHSHNLERHSVMHKWAC